MIREPYVNEGTIYASGIWLARVHFTVVSSGDAIAVRVCDGERDLFAPPVPGDDLRLELADGRSCPFVPRSGNPVAGTYMATWLPASVGPLNSTSISTSLASPPHYGQRNRRAQEIAHPNGLSALGDVRQEFGQHLPAS